MHVAFGRPRASVGTGALARGHSAALLLRPLRTAALRPRRPATAATATVVLAAEGIRGWSVCSVRLFFARSKWLIPARIRINIEPFHLYWRCRCSCAARALPVRRGWKGLEPQVVIISNAISLAVMHPKSVS